MVHARCMPSVRVAYVLGRRRTMAGTCATVGGSYRPSGSPRARPRCSGTRSPRRCTPRRCNAAGSECLSAQRPVAAQRSGCPLTCSGPPSEPQPRFGDCRLHSVWPSQARGGGGHACGGHAATILRLLRGGGIHARPGRRMRRRAWALAPHRCSVCETWDVWSVELGGTAGRGGTQTPEAPS